MDTKETKIKRTTKKAQPHISSNNHVHIGLKTLLIAVVFMLGTIVGIHGNQWWALNMANEGGALDEIVPIPRSQSTYTKVISDWETFISTKYGYQLQYPSYKFNGGSCPSLFFLEKNYDNNKTAHMFLDTCLGRDSAYDFQIYITSDTEYSIPETDSNQTVTVQEVEIDGRILPSYRVHLDYLDPIYGEVDQIRTNIFIEHRDMVLSISYDMSEDVEIFEQIISTLELIGTP